MSLAQKNWIWCWINPNGILSTGISGSLECGLLRPKHLAKSLKTFDFPFLSASSSLWWLNLGNLQHESHSHISLVLNNLSRQPFWSSNVNLEKLVEIISSRHLTDTVLVIFTSSSSEMFSCTDSTWSWIGTSLPSVFHKDMIWSSVNLDKKHCWNFSMLKAEAGVALQATSEK